MQRPCEKFLILIALTTGLACGKAEQPAGGGGIGGIVGSEWHGNYQARVGEELSAARKVTVGFSQDESFKLLVPEDSASSVLGAYKDFPKLKKIILDIKDSSFELFGKAGQSKNFGYQLEGDELKIDGDNGQYLLYREGSDAGGNGSNDDQEEEKALDGHWNCVPGDGSKWKIVITQKSFRASKAVGDKKPIYFEGGVSYKEEALPDVVAVLKINSATLPNLVGARLRLLKKTSHQLEVAELDENDNVSTSTQAITCNL